MVLANIGLLVLASKPKIETLFFLTTDCPISQRYTPEIKRIMKDYVKASDFKLVYEDSGVEFDVVTKHQTDYKIPGTFSLDKDHGQAKKLKVTVVPTAVVVDDKGNVLYFGRIDDSYGRDFQWHPTKERDLRNALQAIQKGEKVPVNKTKVIGCTISF